MRRVLLGITIWTLIASGSFIAVRGFLSYLEAGRSQEQMAELWQHEKTSALPVPDRRAHPDHQRKSPVTARPADGGAIARLSIPRLGASLYVLEGTDDKTLNRGPGHLPGSVLPGEDGNCVIAGHRDTHFRILRKIHGGDEIILESRGNEYRYRVDEMSVVSPDNTGSPHPTRRPASI